MQTFTPIDACLRALAEPTRRAIFERLRHGPSSVSELAAPFEITLAAVVQHLQVLEESGLVRSEKVGRVRTCRIDQDGVDFLTDWLTARRQHVERSLDRLGALLDEEDRVERRLPKRKAPGK